MNEDWCILRCRGQDTLKLAASLGQLGYDVWTPVETLNKRIGPMRRKRSDTMPIMPSYIFAQMRHLIDLLGMSQVETNPNAGFSVFRHNGRFPLIAEEDLAPLRAFERKRIPIDQMPRFTKGEMVKLTEGGFAGLSGVVELTRGQYTLVTFPGFPMPIKISSLLLLGDNPQRFAKAA
jgi:transcription antitermination factor NusG